MLIIINILSSAIIVNITRGRYWQSFAELEMPSRQCQFCNLCNIACNFGSCGPFKKRVKVEMFKRVNCSEVQLHTKGNVTLFFIWFYIFWKCLGRQRLKREESSSIALYRSYIDTQNLESQERSYFQENKLKGYIQSSQQRFTWLVW